MSISIHPNNTFPQVAYSVICARKSMPRLDGTLHWQWIFVRHHARNTWEIPGGRIEPGESPRDCAFRELYEETGARARHMDPAFEYAVDHGSHKSYGKVFLADVKELTPLPPNSEIAEICLQDTLPADSALTYPHIQPTLFAAMQD